MHILACRGHRGTVDGIELAVWPRYFRLAAREILGIGDEPRQHHGFTFGRGHLHHGSYRLTGLAARSRYPRPSRASTALRLATPAVADNDSLSDYYGHGGRGCGRAQRMVTGIPGVRVDLSCRGSTWRHHRMVADDVREVRRCAGVVVMGSDRPRCYHRLRGRYRSLRVYRPAARLVFPTA